MDQRLTVALALRSHEVQVAQMQAAMALTTATPMQVQDILTRATALARSVLEDTPLDEAMGFDAGRYMAGHQFWNRPPAPPQSVLDSVARRLAQQASGQKALFDGASEREG